MNPTYLTIANQGKSSWKRYLAVVFCILATFLSCTIAITYILKTFSDISSIDKESLNIIISENPAPSLLFVGIIALLTLVSFKIAFQHFHKRNFLTLISPDCSVQWSRIFQSFSIWLSLYGINFLVLYLIHPSRYIFTFNFGEWLPFSLLALFVIPILSCFFVILKYAYFLQGVGLIIRNPLFLVFIWGFVIGTYDGYREFPIFWIMNIIYSMFLIWLVIKDNRLELVLGISSANLFIRIIFIRSSEAMLKSPTFFKVAEGISLDLFSIVSLCLISFVFYYIYFKKRKYDPGKKKAL